MNSEEQPAHATTEFVESLACSWALSYRPLSIPPVWGAMYPLALVDVYRDRLVCRGRAQLKRVVPFAVVPLSTIKRATRAGWFPRAARLQVDVATGTGTATTPQRPALFRGDSVDFSPEWLSDPTRASRVVRWVVVESRSHRIDWLLEFLANSGIEIEDGCRTARLDDSPPS